MQNIKLIIYMPALNEEADIQRVIADLPTSIDGIDTVQLLVIDDGSVDRTADLAQASGAQVVSHGKNRGVGAAFRSAVQFALENEADILVGIDADGQFNPNEIPALIQPILAGQADMVVGNRFMSGIPTDMSRIKYWGNQKVAQMISAITGQTFQDVSCGFRAYNRESLLRLNIFGDFTYTHETILSLTYQGLRVSEHPIKVKYFPDRKSRVAGSISRYAIQTSKIILRVLLDYRPMRVFGSFGSLCMAIGIGFELFLMSHYVLTGTFTPYKSTGFIGLGFIIFGLLVLLIALIADMLNRLRINQDKLLYELKRNRYER
ncbi:MAG TPA: glycosyltransferase family 2 protein, partial [Anaerolineales bacterium]|nr:glycosyltransferase family 2 protein [Anaerolineales bacterium]